MASIKLRPTDGSGSNWNNIGNAYDGNESTNASVSVSIFSSPRTLTLNFDTSVIPSGATINSATLTLRSKAGKTTITARVDINGNSEYRVINQKQSTKATNYTADVTSYISDLTSVDVAVINNNWSSNTFDLYELWIDVDYTASTTYTVRFLDWDNSVISTQTVTRGGSATAPSNPTRDGYTFTGWDKSFTNITANTDIHAQYSIKTYTVRFLDWDNTVLDTQTINHGSNATPPPNPTRDGYTFTGWSGNYTNVTANIDIIAQYTQNSSGGEVDTSVKNIKLGSSTIDKLYLGTSQILKAYLGSILLYSYSTGGTGGGDTPVIGDNYQLYTGYPLIVENSSLDANYGSYITEIVGNTTQSSTDLTDIRSVGVLQGDGTYKVDIIASNQNSTQTQTKSIYLPQPLRMVRGYSDRLYWDDTLGKCCIEQKIFKTIIDPYDEAIYIDNILNYGRLRVTLNLNQSDYFSGWYTSPWPTMCNKMATTTHTSWNSVTETSIYFSQDGNCIVVFLESEVSDLDTAKSYLQNLGEIEVYGKYDTARIIETDITDKILFNTYANYTKVITDEKEVAPISMSGNFASSNLWDGVSYLPGRVDDNPTWGEYSGQYTDNWSLIDPYGIQFDITNSSMRGFTLQFENLTSGKYLNFTAISNQEVYKYPEINFYFFDSSKTYLSKVRTGISSDGVEPEVILTNGEMFASVLIPDNATCCEMSFKLTIDTPTPYHIEITNINVMEDDSSLY